MNTQKVNAITLKSKAPSHDDSDFEEEATYSNDYVAYFRAKERSNGQLTL